MQGEARHPAPIRADGWFPMVRRVQARVKEIRHSGIGVYVALASRVNSRGECWPSVRTIARDSGYDVVTVRGALKRLEAAGRLKKRPRGRRKTPVYTLVDLVRVCETATPSSERVCETATPSVCETATTNENHLNENHLSEEKKAQTAWKQKDGPRTGLAAVRDRQRLKAAGGSA